MKMNKNPLIIQLKGCIIQIVRSGTEYQSEPLQERGDVQLIVETEYGYLYDGILYATYREAEAAKNER